MKTSTRFLILLAGVLLLPATRPLAASSIQVQEKLALAPELAKVQSTLANLDAPGRPAAITELVNLVGIGALPEWEAESWLRWAAEDEEPRVAGPAKAWLANLELRSLGLPRPWTPERELRFRRSLAEFTAEYAHPDPRFRKQALVLLLDIARGEQRCFDPRVWAFFSLAAEDPDIRVSHYARFALEGGLAGDENALHQVWVAQESEE